MIGTKIGLDSFKCITYHLLLVTYHVLHFFGGDFVWVLVAISKAKRKNQKKVVIKKDKYKQMLLSCFHKWKLLVKEKRTIGKRLFKVWYSMDN